MKWRCSWCGEPHDENDPPCDECGNHKLEREMEQDGTPDDRGQGHIWACTDCGREHQKHSPPCSRCGNAMLEKRAPQYDDLDELGGTSLRNIVEPKYAAGYLVVAVVVGALALSALGVVSLPAFVGETAPSPPDAPGHADTYAGFSLEDVEAAYVEELNDQRQARDAGSLSTAPALASAATDYNRRWVDAEHGDGTEPVARDAVDRYNPNCGESIGITPYPVPAVLSTEMIEEASDEAALARELQVGGLGRDSLTLDGEYGLVGVDIHVAPDDQLYVTVLLCSNAGL